MTTLKPKEFIQSVLIDELETLVDKHPYFSFIIMEIGIEFLGKCINIDLKNWYSSNRYGAEFKNAIINIRGLQKYKPFLTKYDLYGSFRCGLAHSVLPKYKVTLSSKEQKGHLIEENGRLNLKVEDFYKDFKSACEFVINMDFPPDDKMNEAFIEIPENVFNPILEYSDGALWSCKSNFDQGKASASGAVNPYIIGNQDNE